jgi:hypothetical protein
MMGVILAFLSQNGFERSYKVVLDEIRDQMPSLEPSADILQQRHAAPIKHVETAHFFFWRVDLTWPRFSRVRNK